MVLGSGCVQELNQVAGTGATYSVRCSAQMDVKEGEVYEARCNPQSCEGSFVSGPVSHVVVALDPGRKLVGYAERICIQDLAQASGLFNPALFPVEPKTLEEGGAVEEEGGTVEEERPAPAKQESQ